jgi:hypothetical protein
MRTAHRNLFLVILILVVFTAPQILSAQSHSFSPERAAKVERGVRTFMQTAAHDVTQEGPSAWRKHFADTPAFFMAVNGQLAFANSADVSAKLPDVARAIKHIELRWGDDLRVDPLTEEFAVVATSWHEVITNGEGKREESSGYFTGTVEFRDGRWQFRNAHWSVAVPAAPAH